MYKYTVVRRTQALGLRDQCGTEREQAAEVDRGQ